MIKEQPIRTSSKLEELLISLKDEVSATEDNIALSERILNNISPVPPLKSEALGDNYDESLLGHLTYVRDRLRELNMKHRGLNNWSCDVIGRG